ncbi:ABC transporter domain-containing protein [Candidatus Hydrogenisulfobacillus filiaventi]|uniref:ABC transporter domain-containing protein n=1 Tax=Candidatus Hydrogenisulfobacillus filiaventi TaxID=2707344 RepID=A0A6F8ZFE3_9FIRM|nr:ABC transporter ATP-binding protein [Bacillota bacterium]CAB1128182.1 ABC transporter domain-containing protein [Candidatus Hydrogenisulfobacillus filiaventi]
MTETGSTLLEIRDLVKTYRGGVTANRGISLRLEAGQIVGILGPNGAGKSTLLRQIVGLTRPTSGSVRLGGRVVEAGRMWVKERIAYLPQHPLALADLTVAQAITYSARLRGVPAAEAARRTRRLLESLELAPLAGRPLYTLSGGEHRLAGIATVLAAPAAVVALDEPTNELDPLMRRRVWEEIRGLKRPDRLVLLVSHNVLEAERVLDRVVILHQGQVVADGTPAALRAAVGESVRIAAVFEGPPPVGLAAAGEVEERDEARGRLVLRVDPARVPAVLARVVAAPARLTGVEVSRSGLEDIYLAWRERLEGQRRGGQERHGP